MAKILGLSRDELATFLKSPHQIKQFEQLFLKADTSSTDVTQLTAQVNDLAQDVGDINLSLASINTQITNINTQIQRSVGSFYDTTTQTAAAANTATTMTFNTTDVSQGVSIGTPTSRVYVNATRMYNIQFSAQFDNTTGGSHLAYVWLRVNGFDVPQTGFQIRLKGTDGELVAAWNFFYTLSANDYFEIMWSVADVAVQLTASAAAAPVPAIPSVILTCFNVT